MTNDEIKERLRSYQIPAVGKLIHGFKSNPFMLDASDMGVGKMYQGTALALALKATPLVICKKAGITAWQRVWREHFSQASELPVINYEMLRTGKTDFGAWVNEKRTTATGKTRNVEVFRFNVVPEMIVMWDECHWARSQTSQNGEMLMAVYDQKIRSLGMSATSINSPIHLKTLGACLGLHKVSDYYGFLFANGVQKTPRGMQWMCGLKFSDLWRYTGYDGHKKTFTKIDNGHHLLKLRQIEVMSGIHKRIFESGKGIRLRKTDIPDFPKLTVIPYLVDFKEATSKIQEAYNDMKVRMAADSGRRHHMAILKETQITVETLKLEGMIPDIEAALEEGNSVAVFLNFNKSVDLVSQMLNTDCVIRGGQTQAARQNCIDRYQSNKERAIVANNMAGAESIGLHDLHGGYPRVGFVAPTPWAEMARQCTGRLPRNGSKSPSIVYFPYALGTCEEKTMELMRTKWDNIDAFNDASILETLIA